MRQCASPPSIGHDRKRLRFYFCARGNSAENSYALDLVGFSNDNDDNDVETVGVWQ